MKKGDMIEVSMNDKNFVTREFVSIVDGQYLCKVEGEDCHLFLWKYYTERPWIKIADEFPSVRPSDNIEYKLRVGSLCCDKAADLYWGYTGGDSDIVAWRKI